MLLPAFEGITQYLLASELLISLFLMVSTVFKSLRFDGVYCSSVIEGLSVGVAIKVVTVIKNSHHLLVAPAVHTAGYVRDLVFKLVIGQRSIAEP